MFYLCIFSWKFEKPNVIFEINNHEFLQTQLFTQNKKVSNLRLRMSYLGVLSWDLKKLLPYLMSALSNFSRCNVSCQTNGRLY